MGGILELTQSTIEALSQLTLNGLDGGLSLFIMLGVGFVGWLTVSKLVDIGKKLANSNKK